MTEQPEITTPPPPENLRRRRGCFGRLLRFAVRCFIYPALILALGVAILLFRPISSPAVDRAIRKAALEETGIDLVFDSAVFHLATGEFRAGNVELRDPADGGKLLGIRSVEIFVDLPSVLAAARNREGRIDIRRLVVSDPDEIRIERGEEGTGTAAPLDRLRELALGARDARTSGSMRGVAPAPSGSASASRISVGIRRVEVLGLGARLVSAGGDEPTTTGLAVRGAELHVDFEGSALPSNVVCTGRVSGPEFETNLSFRIVPDERREEAAVDFAVQGFEIPATLPGGVRSRAGFDPLRVRGMVRRSEEGTWRIHADAHLDRMTLAEHGEGTEEEVFAPAPLYVSLEYDGERGRIRLRDLEVQGETHKLAARGWIDLAEPWEYGLELEEFSLRAGDAGRLERIFLREKFIAESPDGAVELKGSFNGRVGQAQLRHMDAEYLIHDLNLELPGMGDPIEGLTLRGRATAEGVTLSEGSCTFQGIPIAASGELKGSPAEGLFREARVAWRTVGEASGISDLLARNEQVPVTDITFRGSVLGEGSLTAIAEEPLPFSRIVDHAILEGRLEFNNAEVKHNEIAAAASGLRGSVRFRNDELVAEEISGRIEDVSFSINGAIHGEGRFWRYPRLSVSVAAAFDLSRIEDYADWFTDRDPDLPDLEGQGSLSASVQGQLEDWRAMSCSGRVRVLDFAWKAPPPWLGGTFHAPRVILDVTDREISIVSAEGVWEGVRLDARGRVSPTGGEVTLEVDGHAKDYQKCVPGALNMFDLDGTASAVCRVPITATAEMPPGVRTFSDLFLGPDDDEQGTPPPLAALWTAEPTGTLQINNVEVTHLSMPTRVTGGYGTFTFDRHHVWNTEPAIAVCGDGSRNNRVMLDVNYGDPRGQGVILTAHVTGDHVLVDSWLEGWRKVPEELRPPRNPESEARERNEPVRPEFSARVTAETREGTFRGITGRNLTGRVTFTDFSRGQSELTWENARAEYGDGNVIASGRWHHEEVDGVTVSDHQVFDVTTNRFDVAALIGAAGGIVSPSEGISSGLATGNVRIERPQLRGVPFTGRGHLLISDSRFVANAFFGELGRVMRLEPIFNNIAFTQIQGEFEVAEGQIRIARAKPVHFENPSLIYPLNLDISGAIGPEKALDLDIRLQFLPQITKVPIVGEVWKIVGREILGRVMSFRMRGTFEKPRATLMP